MSKIVKIEHSRDGVRSIRYLIVFNNETVTQSNSVVGFDITKLVLDEQKKDRKDGHDTDTGPRFGFIVYNATDYGDAFEEVTLRWRVANGHEYARPRFFYNGSWRSFEREETRVLREWSIQR